MFDITFSSSFGSYGSGGSKKNGEKNVAKKTV
jgi:hypothetical protein